MSRRVSLPGASELFRATRDDPAGAETRLTPVPSAGNARTTGRVRHEEKITVYVSAEELLALEQARLVLRAEHGVAVDRGRIVREAVAVALTDLARAGAQSELVRRLS